MYNYINFVPILLQNSTSVLKLSTDFTEDAIKNAEFAMWKTHKRKLEILVLIRFKSIVSDWMYMFLCYLQLVVAQGKLNVTFRRYENKIFNNLRTNWKNGYFHFDWKVALLITRENIQTKTNPQFI